MAGNDQDSIRQQVYAQIRNALPSESGNPITSTPLKGPQKRPALRSSATARKRAKNSDEMSISTSVETTQKNEPSSGFGDAEEAVVGENRCKHCAEIMQICREALKDYSAAMTRMLDLGEHLMISHRK